MHSTVNSNIKRRGIFSWKALTLAVTTALCTPMVMGQDYTKIIEKSQGRDFKEVVAEVEELYKGKNKGQGTGYKQFRRWVDFNSGRLSKDGKVQNLSTVLLEASNKYDAYLRKANKNSRLAAATPSWSLIGAKSNVRLAPGYTNGNGRVDRLAADPSNASILYAGSPMGGLWRSTTGGASWTCLTNSMPSMVSVVGIAIDPSSPVSNRTIYFLSGNDGGFAGLFKSIDNGNTWSPSGLTDKGIDKGRELVMHPTNPQILFAVTNEGIFRSITGGSGWDLVKAGDFHDLKFKPGAPSTVYASSVSQVFISNKGGEINSWTQLTKGLPTDIFGKILLAVSPHQPDYLYALYGSDLKIPGQFSGLYRSMNSGTDFTRRSNTPNIIGGDDDGGDDGNMYGHCMAITASPTNAEEVHVAGINCWKSITGGSTWSRTSKWGADFAGPGNYTHADVHHLYFVGNTLYCA
ncbi:MAG TPA: hypothetical protein VL947_04250, partial [Cytophagales bacterium]|nr:hypothetical protein [Cytophagales bacterium]